jgi:murein DD-endopeptidase MepM/ murein hydrolase activator NlpD
MLDLLVNRGDTLEVLFRRNGLSLTDLAAMVALPDASRALKLLKPGDRLEISHLDGQVLSLRRELDEIKVLSIARQESGFAVDTIERDVDIRTTGAHGEIRTSLFEAGSDAGIADRTTMDMAGIFEWDIDFIQDVRQGDTFTVIYEELWRDGVKLRDGEIVAAEFVNQGKSFRAARFRDDTGRTGYFTPEGRSVRKAFIRAPLNFTRISSNFNPSRRHPVLNTIRAHRGVDYAAPTGTPVRAAGDGKVLFRGVQGGYGNTIILQHGGNITTLYGHLSRFGTARAGARVDQGDIIGYVGRSGLATGPHLHYEYRVNGAHRNPRTVSLPPADPIAPEQQTAFQAATDPLWRQLDSYLSAPTTTTQAAAHPSAPPSAAAPN